MSAALRAIQLLPAAALLAGGWQSSPTEPAPPILRITVTLIQVDAVVTDSSGRHVPDLHKEDFQVLQDGQPQKVTWFAYVAGPPPAVKPSAPAPKLAKDQAPVPLAPAPLAAGQVQRTVALVVDDMALSFDNMVRTRDALRRYIEREMQPGDLVALVRTGGGVAMLEQFTTDKRILLEGVGLLKWKFVGRQGVAAIDPVNRGTGGREHGPQAEPEALDYGYSLAALGALSTLEDVIQGMKRFPGRKSIVFLSDSLKMAPDVMDAVDRITDLANRSAVSLYAVDPSGLKADSALSAENTRIYTPDHTTRRFPTLGGDGPSDGPNGDPNADPGAPDRDDEFSRQQGLSLLAARTGGIFYHNSNDIPGAIRAAIDDQLGYYLLGYSPAEGTFDKNPRRVKYHKVTVRAARPGLHVRWKSGFEGVTDDALPVETDGAPKTREQQLADALVSPFTATGIKVRLTSLFMDSKPQGPMVFSMLHFDAKDLTFTRQPDDTWNARVDVITSAYRGLKQPIRQGQRVQPIKLNDATYQRAMKEGLLMYVPTPATLAGTFIIRAVVRDWGSERIGSASQVIQVPDVSKGQFALSGIAVTLAPRELLEKLANPAIGTLLDGQVEGWSEGGPAVRHFRPGQVILYGYSILNPKLHGMPKQPQLTSQTRLYRDGKLVFAGPVRHEVEAAQDDPARYITGGVLRLGTSLVPGEYILQVTVIDGLASKKKAQLSQWMDFEVLP